MKIKNDPDTELPRAHYLWIVFSVVCVHLLVIHTVLFAQNDDIYFESLSAENGLSQLTVSSIFQDSKGFIWFGTMDGLNLYDGYSFEIFKTRPGHQGSISSNYINAITEDSLGYIWIGTEGGLNRYSYETGEFLSFFKDGETDRNISHDKASFVFRDKKGVIWVGTEQGLDCPDLKNMTFKKRTFNNFLYNNRIIAIHDDSYGNLWIGTLKGLVKFNPVNESYQIFRHESENSRSLSDNHIRTLYEDSRKNLWIGTSNGLNFYDPRNNQFLHFGSSVYQGLSLTNNAVRCITDRRVSLQRHLPAW